MKCTNYFQIRSYPISDKVHSIGDEAHIGIIQDRNLKLKKYCNDNI